MTNATSVNPPRPKYQPLHPVQAAARLELLARTLAIELEADRRDFPDPDADCLTVDDLATLGRELGHYGHQILDFRAYRRCACGEVLTSARELASGSCGECRQDALERHGVWADDPAFAEEVGL